MRSAQPVVVGILLAAALLGGTVRLLTVPPVTAVLLRATGGVERSGLADRVALDTAEHVRGYVTGARSDPLPAALDGRPAFGPNEVSHLDDVAAVLAWAGWATLACVLASAAWLWVRLHAGDGVAGARALRIAGGTLVSLAAAAGLVAVLDFERFFAGFHALFFAPGTWQFPADSLLIRLFAGPFWMSAGALWAGLVLACGVVALAFARRAARRGAAHGAQRSGRGSSA